MLLLSNKKTYVVLTALVSAGLSACGYTPLYKDMDSSQMENIAYPSIGIGEIVMDNIDYRPGERRIAQMVRQRLVREFTPTTYEVRVDVNIEESVSELAVRQDATVERLQVNLVAQLVTLRTDDNAVDYTARLTSTAAYNVEDTPYSTESGRLFARETAAKTLADDIIRQVYYFYKYNALNANSTNK